MPLIVWGIKGWWPSSTCTSVCLSRALSKSSMEESSKLKLGRKEAYDTVDPWPHLEIERSKVKVSLGRLMLRRKMRHIFRRGDRRTSKLGTRMEYDDTQRSPRTYGTWRPASLTRPMTSKLKALGGCLSHHLHGAGAYCGDRTIQAAQLVIIIMIINIVIIRD